MSLCDQLRPYRDGEMGPLARWRMERHLRRCPRCTARTEAEEQLTSLLAADFEADTPAEREALARVESAWRASIPAPDAAPAAAVRSGATALTLRRRWLTASAAVAVAAAGVAVTVLTGPRRALAGVADAMNRVRRFHIRMEVPQHATRFEAWGEKGVATRVEQWEGGRRTLVLVDDGRTLRRYYPEERVLHESKTRLRNAFRQAAGFNASGMLRQAAKGRLFADQEWLGRATAREVARVRRNGVPQRRIQVDLEGGFFERMIIYADLQTDRLTQANLYTDSRSPDESPFARVHFDYPERLDPGLFRPSFPPGSAIRRDETDLPW